MQILPTYSTQEGGGGLNRTPPCTFDTIHPIFYNNHSLYFELIETLSCLIGFHGNHSHINDVTSGRHFGFWIFKFSNFFSFSNLNTENSQKTIFSDWNLQNFKIYCKIISI